MTNVDNSEWSMIYVLIWDSHLTEEEIKSISSSLNTYLKTGVPLKFNTGISKPVSNEGNKETKKLTYIDKYKYLNLTDIQKKMLL